MLSTSGNSMFVVNTKHTKVWIFNLKLRFEFFLTMQFVVVLNCTQLLETSYCEFQIRKHLPLNKQDVLQ